QGCQLQQVAEYFHQIRAKQFTAACEKDCKIFRYERAEKAIRIAVDEARLCPSNKEPLVNSLAWLAYVLHAQLRYYEAEPVYRETLDVSDQIANLDKRKITSTLEGLAKCYEDEGAYNAASKSMTEAITLLERGGANKHNQAILQDRLHLADIQYRAGHYLESIRSCQLAINNANPKADFEVLADSCGAMGFAYEKLRRTKEAEAAFGKSAEIAKSCSKDQLARHLQELGLFYERKGDYAKSKENCGRSLKLREELFVADAQKLLKDKKLVLVEQTGPWQRKDLIVTLEEVAEQNTSTHHPDPLLADVARSMSSVPRKVVDVLSRTGCRVVIVPRLTAVSEEFRTGNPAGYADGASYDSTGGVFEDRRNLVLIPRKVSSPVPFVMWDNPWIVSAVRHEVGHALDEYLELYSYSDAFKRVYLADKVKVTKKQKKSLAYFLQPDFRGQRETMAELFDILCGTQDARAKELSSAFPKTSSFLKENLTSKGLLDQGGTRP
ncbi:MAG: hypothetical protein C5B53_10020, partial [Candidatus Melainabacteria bacterium]